MTLTRTERQSDYPVDRLFIDRWSSRAFTGAPIPKHDLFTAFEAARWAPSSLNFQPWRFVYALRDSAHWPAFLDLLAERNRLWAQHAAALVFFISLKTIAYGDKTMPSPSHAFDTGAAWSNFAHQAALLGYRTRGIGGFDRAAAPNILGVPDGFDIIAAAGIGVPASAETLAETFRGQDRPSQRHPLSHLVFEGAFTPQSEER